LAALVREETDPLRYLSFVSQRIHFGIFLS